MDYILLKLAGDENEQTKRSTPSGMATNHCQENPVMDMLHEEVDMLREEVDILRPEMDFLRSLMDMLLPVLGMLRPVVDMLNPEVDITPSPIKTLR